jgi:hypothetical protein
MESGDRPRLFREAAMGLQEAIAIDSDPAEVMDRILEEILRLVPAADGAAILLCSGPSTLNSRHLDGTDRELDRHDHRDHIEFGRSCTEDKDYPALSRCPV